MKLPVTAVIVTYNSRTFIGECLRSLREAGNVSEILVVDNASTDGCAEVVSREYPEARLVVNEKNFGYARGVNRGLREARERYVLVLNPDVRLLPGSVEALWRAMESAPSVGIAAPKLLNPDGTLQYSCRRFYTFGTFLARRTFLRRLLPLRRVERRHLMMDEDHDRSMTVDWVIGGALLVRREAVEDVGPMDERFFLYFEDVDWCYRMSKRGWRVLYQPEAMMVHHHRRESARSPMGRSLRTHIASSLRFYEKWSGVLYLLKRNRRRMTGVLLLAGDLVALNAAFLLAYALRAWLAFALQKPVFPLGVYGGYLVLLDIVALLCFYAFGLYRRGRTGDWADRLIETSRALLVATIVVMALTFLSYRQTFSRSMLVLFAVCAAILVTAARGLLVRLYEAAVSQRFDRRRLVVLGPEDALSAAEAAHKGRPQTGYDPIFLSLGSSPAARRPEGFLGFLQDERVSDVLLLWSGAWPAEWTAAVPGWMRAGIVVRIAPEFAPLLGGRMRMEDLGGIASLRLDSAARPGLLGLGKRANDSALAVILLVALAPFLAVHACLRAIRGAPLTIERLRAAGPRGVVVLKRLAGIRSPALAAYAGLPSVLSGRIALVGVAPLTPEEVGTLPAALRDLHMEARPGLLGPWGPRSGLEPAEQRRLDLEYVLGWTVARDWKILVRNLAGGRPAPAVSLNAEVS
jgi:GT2 family glycosyltransferase